MFFLSKQMNTQINFILFLISCIFTLISYFKCVYFSNFIVYILSVKFSS